MTQGGQGATPERGKKGAIRTIETMTAGEFAQKDEWADIVALMVHQGILAEDERGGWEDYCRVRGGGSHGSGSGSGWKQQEWMRFGQIIGTARLNWLAELWDYPIPRNQQDMESTKWRLRRCLGRIKESLLWAEDAARQASKEIEALRKEELAEN